MKLFLISQNENTAYETYDSAVVVAPDEETARNMDPSDGTVITKWDRMWKWAKSASSVKVEYLGEAADELEQGVVCASYNAG